MLAILGCTNSLYVIDIKQFESKHRANTRNSMEIYGKLRTHITDCLNTSMTRAGIYLKKIFILHVYINMIA